MSTALRLLKGLWDLIVGALADFVGWLGRPGNKLKLVCALLAVALTYKALESRDRAQQIIVIRTQCDTAKGELKQQIAGKDAALAQIDRNLRAEAAKLNVLLQKNSWLQAEVDRKAAAAERSAAAFAREYAQRPPTCNAALAALAAACPTLSGY